MLVAEVKATVASLRGMAQNAAGRRPLCRQTRTCQTALGLKGDCHLQDLSKHTLQLPIIHCAMMRDG